MRSDILSLTQPPLCLDFSDEMERIQFAVWRPLQYRRGELRMDCQTRMVILKSLSPCFHRFLSETPKSPQLSSCKVWEQCCSLQALHCITSGLFCVLKPAWTYQLRVSLQHSPFWLGEAAIRVVKYTQCPTLQKEVGRTTEFRLWKVFLEGHTSCSTCSLGFCFCGKW